ncbi:hypothetical protein [endosymbiont GvMRE of Glomus versiforme]|nr:hypothetical protein [endosymbiont GvMRE of Glomus versiforme]RHZ36597.1 hypothetical protein GvMRE_I2g550 [endosymbiont GvMRE of Glomus versiforme]RHZ37425.1 hypothetical protein GvMRE_I1g732 [endosymbiont GvMRE of Glomus versiforme]
MSKYFIWFTLCLIAGFYFRHWVHTGAGQFRQLNHYLGGGW